MNCTEMEAGLREVEKSVRHAQFNANLAARVLLLDPTLRHVSPSYLKDLKRRLKQFDMTTARWTR